MIEWLKIVCIDMESYSLYVCLKRQVIELYVWNGARKKNG